VTGATSGIGAACARLLASAGAEVFLVARRRDLLARIAGEIGAHGLPADLADDRQVEAMSAKVSARLGGSPDILVHAAGVFSLAPLHQTGLADLDRSLSVNLRSAFLLARAFLPGMLRRNRGQIVLVGSVAGRTAFPDNSAYSASKFGLRGMHEVLREETRGTGVRTSLVEPGACDTPLWDPIDPERHPGLPPRSAMLEARQVAEAILFLATRPATVQIPLLQIERT
jgi:NADP-dependent 3-hydroxy acid dehydrogenase YdfG